MQNVPGSPLICSVYEYINKYLGVLGASATAHLDLLGPHQCVVVEMGINVVGKDEK